jgi:hypothetical protein
MQALGDVISCGLYAEETSDALAALPLVFIRSASSLACVFSIFFFLLDSILIFQNVKMFLFQTDVRCHQNVSFASSGLGDR